MFNLLISFSSGCWNLSPYEYDRSRAAVEYTADEISERYKSFNEKTIAELKTFPTLFVTENEATESRIGYITNIRVRERTIILGYEFDLNLPALPIGSIEAIRADIDLGRWELSRTHWAIKDEPIFDILIRHGYLNKEQVKASQKIRIPDPPVIPPIPSIDSGFNNSQVFIVHGHDEITKLDAKNFISNLGLDPIILNMQASYGMTIIEKIERYSNVGFAIVLYTPCDVGSKVGELTMKYRSRQNVVFEHGYLIGKLNRSRVVAIVKGDVETPNDISGVVYIDMDTTGNWQKQLKTELKSVGYQV